MATTCTIKFNGDYGYEMKDGDNWRTVNLKLKKCTCRLWDLGGIPCHHAIKALVHKKRSTTGMMVVYLQYLNEAGGVLEFDYFGALDTIKKSLPKKKDKDKSASAFSEDNAKRLEKELYYFTCLLKKSPTGC
ncbi:hypothetical protein HAX54_004512 [Datura stramonium]|uniref:SWIM-type domain-containing protein n=1 Tax=Datura stramonium TaxID=4076 RepID=A0ABS8RW24_DATST|nr:hypothetical protein [Datura stramonium]